ncbi:MAG: hypothetical protein NTX65_03650 [Ignavibacteriales bacterium]|nr:hypothetical protein [Ignavibacteriales bacterium]
MESKSNKAARQFSPSTPSMMDRWIEQKAKLKKKFPNLTNNDLLYHEGKKNEMFENLRIKLNLSKEEWKKMIDKL